jgi:ribosomal protein L28
MARRSDISGKWPVAWNRRSHSMKATKRWFKPNIIRKWIKLENWLKIRIKLTAKEYKKMRKEGII